MERRFESAPSPRTGNRSGAPDLFTDRVPLFEQSKTFLGGEAWVPMEYTVNELRPPFEKSARTLLV
jgi:hypothetical protein